MKETTVLSFEFNLAFYRHVEICISLERISYVYMWRKFGYVYIVKMQKVEGLKYYVKRNIKVEVESSENP